MPASAGIFILGIGPFDICIELAGRWFHECPKCYPGPLKRHKIARIKDARRFAFFASRDLEVHVFWECEIEDNPSGQRARLRELALKIQPSDGKKKRRN